MKAFKNERIWQDLSRADKNTLLAGIIVFALLSAGIYTEHKKVVEYNIAKSEAVR